MSDILDGIGTASEGGLFARVLEPQSGAKTPHPHQPENCLNCGAPLTGAYCHACGQRGHLHRTIGAFMHDLLHGALHFEGKLWRTLPMLMFRPGALTRRYIDGERARFVSPMALFLFSVFLMFAVFQMVGLTLPTDVDTESVQRDVAAGMTDALAEGEVRTVEGARDLLEAERDRAEAALDTLAADDPGRAAATAALAEAEDDLTSFDEVQTAVANDGGEDTFDTGSEFTDALVAKWRDDPGLMLYKLQTNAYKFSWLLIPISVPFVWLLFAWKRRFKAYDHAIFVTYSLSFMSLLFIVASLAGAMGVPEVAIALPVMLIPPLHLYKQLRGTYALGRFSAFWRLLVLSVFIWIVALLFFQLLLLLGAM